jgi:hypothetical protein
MTVKDVMRIRCVAFHGYMIPIVVLTAVEGPGWYRLLG